MDKHKPQNDTRSARPLSKRYKGMPTPAKPKVSRADRLISARDSVNDYQSARTLEDSALLRQRFVDGVFEDYDLSSQTSLQGFAALAERKIIEAKRSGQFKNLPGKGKPAERDHHAGSPHLDYTEYFLNRIIKRQGAKPLWIQAQNDLDDAMEFFRRSLRDDWKRQVARRICSHGGSLGQHLERAREFSRVFAIGKWNEDFTRPWEDREVRYHVLWLKEINDKIRDYNAIAPYSVRRTYLRLEDERIRTYMTAAPDIANEIEARANAPKSHGGGGFGIRVDEFKNFFRQPEGQVENFVDNSQSFGLKEWWRSLFKRDSANYS
jgi:DnaJ family protein C protein 28